MACGGIGEWFGLLKISISSLPSATLNKATIEVKMIYLEYKSPNSPHIPTSLQSYALLHRNSGTAMEHVHTEENRQRRKVMGIIASLPTLPFSPNHSGTKTIISLLNYVIKLLKSFPIL